MRTRPKLIGGVSGPIGIEEIAQRWYWLQRARLGGRRKSLVRASNQTAQERDQAVSCRNLCVACAIHTSRSDAARSRIEAAGVSGGEAWRCSTTQNVIRNEGRSKSARTERLNRKSLILSAKAHGMLAMSPDCIVLRA